MDEAFDGVESTEAHSRSPLTSVLSRWPSDCAVSPVWEEHVRREVKETKIPEQELNRRRSQLLIPGSRLDLGKETAQIPILLLQQPGCTGKPTHHLPTTYQPSTHHLPTTYQPPTHHLPTTYPPPTNHLPTTYQPPTNHVLTSYPPPTVPTTYRPPTNHLPTTYQPPTDHLPTTYQPCTDHLPTTYQPCTDHLPTTYQPLFLQCSLLKISFSCICAPPVFDVIVRVDPQLLLSLSVF